LPRSQKSRPRASSFDEVTYVPMPDQKARQQAFGRNTQSMEMLAPALRAKLAATLAAKTDGYTAADIKSICEKAGRLAWREGGSITMKHFDQVLADTPPSVSPADRARYEGMARELGASP
jgi:transitional endoplasmic reticulum ATPase